MHNSAHPPAPPVALTIGGSDSVGGAGIQADLKTFAVLGCHGTSALTAITAQNTTGVQAVEVVDPVMVVKQIDAVARDVSVAGTKTGMLAHAATIAATARAVERYRLEPLVVDPVMVAKSGDSLIDAEAVEALTDWLVPLATVLTPNAHEAARLLAKDHETTGPAPVDASEISTDVDTAADAAQMICNRYQTPVCVVTGIRRVAADGEVEAVDVCCHGRQIHEIAGPWHDTPYTHGSGCAYSAAIAASLSHGADLYQALRTAKDLTSAAVARGVPVGAGAARPVNPMAWLDPANAAPTQARRTGDEQASSPVEADTSTTER